MNYIRLSYKLFALAVTGVLAPGCLAEPDADLTGPQVVHASPCSGEQVVDVWSQLTLTFSEPIEPSSVSAGDLVVVPWHKGGPCDDAGRCTQGVCTMGQCWISPITSDLLAAVNSGEAEAGEPLQAWWQNDHVRLIVQPHLPLLPNHRYSLLAGLEISDRSGAGLLTQAGEDGVRCDFETGSPSSSGPQAQLIWPPDGVVDVSPNVAELWLGFTGEVRWDALSTFTVVAANGTEHVLANPRPCPEAYVAHTCVAWEVRQPLQPGTHYRPGAGTVTDSEGRPAIAPDRRVLGFRTGMELAPSSPLAGLELTQEGPCLVVTRLSPEPVQLSLHAVDEPSLGLHALVSGQVWSTRIDPSMQRAAGLMTVAATDVEGRRTGTFATWEGREVPYGFLAITEVLANPKGPEPTAEFVELYDTRTEGPAVSVSGLRLADETWPDIEAQLQAGATPPGDEVPAFVSSPGQYTLVVGPGFDPSGDVHPAPGTLIVALESSLGEGGLTNSGEPVTLYVHGPQAVAVSLYGDHIYAGGSGYNGRSVVRDQPEACDAAAAWRIADVPTPGFAAAR